MLNSVQNNFSLLADENSVITLDGSCQNYYEFDATENVELVIKNVRPGQSVTLVYEQGAAGPFTLSMASWSTQAIDGDTIAPSNVIGSRTVFTFFGRSTSTVSLSKVTAPGSTTAAPVMSAAQLQLYAADIGGQQILNRLDLANYASTLAIPAATLDVDGFDIEVEFTVGTDFGAGIVEVFSADTSAGNRQIYIQWNGYVWHFGAFGADVLLASTVNYEFFAIPIAGQNFKVRFWFFPQRGLMGCRFTANNYRAPDTLGTPAARTPVDAVTAVYPGSNRGSGVNSLASTGAAALSYTARKAGASGQSFNVTAKRWAPPAEFVTIGDSIECSNALFLAPSSLVYTTAAERQRLGFAGTSISGAQIQQQAATFAASRFNGDPLVNAICIAVGINNVNASQSTATILAHYTAIIAQLKASNPNAAIIMQTMGPAGAILTAPEIVVWGEVNAAITAGLPGVNYTVTQPSIIMGGGTAFLLPAYDSFDGVHPNNAGRAVIATYRRAALRFCGLL